MISVAKTVILLLDLEPVPVLVSQAELNAFLYAESNVDSNLPKGYAFVAFLDPWSPSCQRLGPVWAEFYNKKVVSVAWFNCMESPVEVCGENKISAYPTIRLYLNGDPIFPDYNMEHTVEDLSSYVAKIMRRPTDDGPLSFTRVEITILEDVPPDASVRIQGKQEA